MSLGAGFEYLMRSVARGDGMVPPSTPLTRYYLDSGTPAGYWLGGGLAGLAGGDGVAVGSLVSEEGLWRVLGMLADPVTEQPLGRAPQRSCVGRSSRAVAGFDLTFSVPKSVSVLWALADARTQEVIHDAHREAIALALRWAEQNVVFTRTGAGGRQQEKVRGLVCAAFDHWDSRAGDPHLHTHVVVANRVQTPDGRWLSLDGATLFRYTVALSELHEGLVHDLLTARLGVTWEARGRAHSVAPRWDIAGVPVELVDGFSSRSAAIADSVEELIRQFTATRGRRPSQVETIKLRQQATLQTRPEKQLVPLAQRMAGWREQAAPMATRAIADIVTAIHAEPTSTVPVAGGEAAEIAVLGRSVLAAVAGKRAVFTEANVLAEAHRQLHARVFAQGEDRLAAAQLITAAALGSALPLDTAPERVLRRGAARFTTAEILDAETRVLDAGRALDGPALDPDVAAVATGSLGPVQATAVVAIATSARRLDLLVGPAGTGKTTSLAALKRAWEMAYGPGSVTGLAPSAAAAQVLGDELGVATDNTAKWLVEHERNSERQRHVDALAARLAACSSRGTVLARRLAAEIRAEQAEIDRWSARPGQLIIVDEASLAGTLALDRIVTAASTCGAKVLLVGDWAQLGAVDAGGAFHMLAHDGPDAPGLDTVRRFTNQWEADACLQLRAGDPAAVDAYAQHERIAAGDRADMLHAVFDRWAADTDAGLTSAMIATDAQSVQELNALAQAHHRDTGTHGLARRQVPRWSRRPCRYPPQRPTAQHRRWRLGQERRHLDCHRHAP